MTRYVVNSGTTSSGLSLNPGDSIYVAGGGTLDFTAIGEMNVASIGGTARFLDGVLVPARCLVNGTFVRQEAEADRIDYLHLELDTHDIVFAEGVPSETYVEDGNRSMFHNAGPLAPAAGAALYCAPRLDQGEQLEAIRTRLGGTSALPALDGAALAGQIDQATHTEISGWADDGAGPVRLELLVDGAAAGAVVANFWRRDLAEAGIADGARGFHVRITPPLDSLRPHVVELRRVADAAPLGHPVLLPAAPRLTPAIIEALRELVDQARPEQLPALRGALLGLAARCSRAA